MSAPRISASSYSNTAPLVWSFLYGRNRGKVEVIMDTAPARSAELLAQDRVDAALVPVIAAQTIADVRLIPGVCVGARERVRSVCLVTDGRELEDVRSVALDTSSRTSAVLTKIIFNEFLGFDPNWRQADPDIHAMLSTSDAALLIGDPALSLSSPYVAGTMAGRDSSKDLRTYDLAELWHKHTGLGFVFAMWMTRRERVDVDLAAARDEGLEHINDIIANYTHDIGVTSPEMHSYLSENISYSPDESMQKGMELYFDLAWKCGLINEKKPLMFIDQKLS